LHFPDDAHLLRHRGHRYISLRRFEDAREDLTRAAQLVTGQADEHEFYGAQLKDDIYQVLLDRTDRLQYTRVPVTEETITATKHLYKATLHSSIHYHLALAHYLAGDFSGALPHYENTIASAVDDEMKVAASDWRYMALRRMGRDGEATASLDSLQLTGGAFSDSHYFRRWRMYRGELDPSELVDPGNPDRVAVATQGYGVGNWHLYNGNPERAKEIFAMVTNAGSKDAFGFIASEVELARMATG
jgi:tetratricopeptide (TPR) repeat protein